MEGSVTIAVAFWSMSLLPDFPETSSGWLTPAEKALAISKKLGYTEMIINSELTLKNIDSLSGNFEGAFRHQKQYYLLSDSINNIRTKKASIRSELNHEYEKGSKVEVSFI